MRILISGICGFVGSTLAKAICENVDGTEVFGFDNFVRQGSEVNRLPLQQSGIQVHHADLRIQYLLCSRTEPFLYWLPSGVAGVMC